MSQETIEEIREANLQKFTDALNASNKEEMSRIYELLQPIDVAMEFEDYDDELLQKACVLISDNRLVEIIEQADEELQVRMVRYIDNYRMIFLFNQMQKDDVVDILGNLPIKDKSKSISIEITGLKSIRTKDKHIRLAEPLQINQPLQGGILL